MSDLLCHFLIGVPGAGKSTFAQQLISFDAQYMVISPDQIREQLYGDPILQGDWSAIQQQIRRDFDQAIRQGSPVIYDATNIQRQRRIDFLREFSPQGVKWLGWLFQTPVKDCIQRNQNQDHSVPIDLIIDAAQLLNQFPPQPCEGLIAVQEVPLTEEGWLDMERVILQITEYGYQHSEI
ncbi:MAG: ATP-binding protein [Acaryochloridaceae cyanobacterium SU_2_1]|nr:ATP-binding protein [Acaryochloridaceae cyanobacterium SU_2_1]NJM95519.1 ATP-binding protein [Acaryochloridaceae cyanobacterium CSU_5_19]